MGTLSGLFDPERIAVVGATDREGAVGRAVIENLASFAGDVIGVNPGRDEVLGVPCVPSIGDADDIDLAVVVVPPAVVVDVVADAGNAGVENVVVITAGFGEAGGEGARRERALREVAEEYDLTLVGPNSLGIMSAPAGMNATFGPDAPDPGPISFMSQSGAFITAVLDWAGEAGMGFRHIVSLGNETVLGETDFVRAWADDDGTEVVLGYLEGIDDGRAFVDAARESDTPIVLVKSGRTDAGAQAASSHTGTMAGSEQAYRAGLDEAGVLRAESVQDLFDAARVLAGQPIPDRDDVAVITNAGGPGVMATDAVGDSRLSMAAFSTETVETLDDRLPDEGNVHNPVDVVGDASIERFRETIDTVLADEGVGCAVVISCPTAVLSYDALAEAVVELQAAHGKPVVTSLMGGKRTEAPDRILRNAGIPNYFDPARAVRGLDALAKHADTSRREPDRPVEPAVDRERADTVLDEAAAAGRTSLGVEAMDLLSAYGIPIAATEVVDSPADARRAAERMGGPVAMKVVSPDVPHKSDIGGVAVGVALDDVPDAYERIRTRVRSYRPDATVLGVAVQELVDLDDGTETIVGATRDPQFGPLVLFGLGGVFVEVLEDVTVRLAPVGERTASEMIDEVDAAPLLRGARGREPVDEGAVVEAIGRLSRLVADHPAILELDVNPLIATSGGVTAVDLQCTIDPERHTTEER